MIDDKKKKILLVYANNEKYPYPIAPLGLCLIAGLLEENYDVKVFDGMFESKNALINLLKDFKPDYIGASIRNIDNLVFDKKNRRYYIDSIYNEFILPIRENSRNPLILGGSGFSVMPVEIFNKYNADYGITGEGEMILPLLLKCLDEKKDPSSLPCLITRKNKTIKHNINVYDIRKMNFSDIDLKVDFLKYIEKASYPVQTKRGCIHKCIYCTYPLVEGRIYRIRSEKEIVDEIEKVKARLGSLTFEFVDSTFNDPPGHAERICREIIRRKLKINIRTMGINPANISEELLELMLRAGFKQIDCSPDTASRKMLKNLKKNFNYSELVKAAEIIKNFNMPTMWFFIFGGPGENEDTLKESFDFIDKYIYEFDMVHMTAGIRIFPNTALYDIALKQKIISKRESILEPVHYISKKLNEKAIMNLLNEFSKKKANCVISSESSPSPEMIKQAINLRKKLNFNEPMFRTFLRIRKVQLVKKYPSSKKKISLKGAI